eukprot:1434885-Alexandrium_andersonii.AAC.1
MSGGFEGAGGMSGELLVRPRPEPKRANPQILAMRDEWWRRKREAELARLPPERTPRWKSAPTPPFFAEGSVVAAGTE